MSSRLKELRKAAGLSLEDAVRIISELEPTAPKTRVGLWHIEQNGTDRLRVIDAMAKAYKVPRQTVEELARSK